MGLLDFMKNGGRRSAALPFNADPAGFRANFSIAGELAFLDLMPEIAKTETRGIDIPAGADVPEGRYGLIEWFCVDPSCDCKRVSIEVAQWATADTVAVIDHTFDGGEVDPVAGRTFLDRRFQRLATAPQFLRNVGTMLYADPAYAQRVERHYCMVRAALADPQHPIHARIRLIKAAFAANPEHAAVKTRRAESPATEVAALPTTRVETTKPKLPPGSIGTSQNPVMLRVSDEAKAKSMAAFAAQHGLHYIMEIASNKPDDVSDFNKVGQLRGAPSHLSRHERRAWEKKHKRR